MDHLSASVSYLSILLYCLPFQTLSDRRGLIPNSVSIGTVEITKDSFHPNLSYKM